MYYDTIIIGGGAAGFAAAAFLNGASLEPSSSEAGNSLCLCKVLIIEKNHQPMKKLSITGKGRCNLTNNCDVETVLRNIVKNPAFVRSAMTKFTPADTMAFFESLGVPVKTERGGRVFPVSDKARDIVQSLHAGITPARIITDRARSLIIEDGLIKGVKCVNGVYYAPNVIVATGGMSYPKTGSTGDGYELARQAGHKITPIKPALVALETVDDVSQLAGLTLKNVKLTLNQFTEQGEMLFTHFGVSGPLVLSASWYIKELSSADLSIDFKPALDEKTLDNRILRDFSCNKNRQFKNALSGLLPEKMVDVFVERSGINPHKKVNEITKAERRGLGLLFKDFRLEIKNLRPIDEAVITDGGVCVGGIDPKTMQSKLVGGLYFAGEVIDVAGFTGGFNLQVAWATAYAAARAIYRSTNRNDSSHFY